MVVKAKGIAFVVGALLLSSATALGSVVPLPSDGDDWRNTSFVMLNEDGTLHFDSSSFDGFSSGSIGRMLIKQAGISTFNPQSRGHSTGDQNDRGLFVSPGVVPEPGTLMLLGSGLVAVGYGLRRLRSR